MNMKIGDIVWVCTESTETEQYQDRFELNKPPRPKRIKIVEIDERPPRSIRGYGYYDSDELDEDSNNEYRAYERNVFRTIEEANRRYTEEIVRYLRMLNREIETWAKELVLMKELLR